MRVRPATVADAPAISQLTAELGYAMDAEASRAALTTMLQHPVYAVLVAESDSTQLAGWVAVENRLSLESGAFAEITGLVVGSAFRKRGVGKQLLQSAEQWALRQGFQSLRVRSSISRQESHPFYESLGFVLNKTQHVYLKSL